MPTLNEQQIQDSAAKARKAKEKLPDGYFKNKVAERKAKMGPIHCDETYPQQKLMELAGWTNLGWKKAIESGLEHRQHGNRVYVTGAQFFRWVEKGNKSK